MKNYIYDLKGWLAEKSKKIITVYPAGGGGVNCAEQLKKHDIDFAFFIDSDSKKEYNFIENKIILSPKILDSFNKKEIFIFVASSNYYSEIANTLTEKGFIENEDFFELPENYGNFIKKSEETFEYAKKYPLDSIPLFNRIEIETINRCNGRCSFCPINVKNDKREKVVMSEELFYSVISQLKELNYSKYVELRSNNEPFLDKRIPGFIMHTRKELLNAFLCIQTNGTLLTLDLFKQIIDHLDFLIINNYSDDFEFNKNTKDIYEYSKNSEELRKKVRICKRKENEVLRARAGYSPNGIPTKCNGMSCILPFSEFIVRPNGKISLCCVDALGNVTLGDLSKESILEIWNGELFVEYRKKILRGRENIPLCIACDSFPNFIHSNLDVKKLLPDDSFFCIGRKDLYEGLKCTK
jgi:MoaA/NifB/PqqE/SkfB family radical SAM enzyme